MAQYFRYIGGIVILGLFLQGCSTTLQSSWRDFNAYFNTYYNAKTSFDKGVELQEQQDASINPERPIRIHPTPRRAGLNDFEHAAQKSADVIRFHPRSRWVDNAIELIGMSYFYQQQYFSADQKFVELLATTSDPDLRQSAIYWRGRAALELENYVEGINYIQSRLFSTEFDWDPEIEAEIKMIIAQLFVARGEYEDAEVYLAEALPDVRNRNREMRAYFLHGQLLEMLERYDEAFDAYDRATHRSNPNYDLIYYAELKMGIVARKRGDLDWAFDHFSSMSRDDRHYSYIAAIEYEIARTLHEQSYYTRARDRYEQVLRRRTNNPDREVQAKIFYGIAEIYRDFYLDYNLTAAYFDSSAQQATNIQYLPKEFDADLMSRSYGEYTRLQNEVHRLDSLLWLGGLDEAEFDSVIAEIQKRKIAEIEQEQRQQQRAQMVSIDQIEEAGEQAEEHTENGFLNHKNRQMMMQMRQAFQAYWGARPLVDDWRRMEAVRLNIVRQYEEEGEDIDDVDEIIEGAVAPQEHVVEVDVSEVPFSEEEKRETQRMIASHEYEIGNVFYTSLAMPDSAARYYRSVMNRFPDSQLAPQAIYSLSELYHAANDSVQAMQYAMQLVDFYPHTIYAERMADRYMLELVRPEKLLTREDSISAEYQNIKAYSRSENRAGKLRKFAEKYPESDKAPEALYRSVVDYIEAAREDEQYAFRLNDLSLHRNIWLQEQQEMDVFRDSVRALLEDSAYVAAITELDTRIHDATVEDPGEVPENANIEEPDAEPNAEADVSLEEVPDDETDAAAIADTLAHEDERVSGRAARAPEESELRRGETNVESEDAPETHPDDPGSVQDTLRASDDEPAVPEEEETVKTIRQHLEEIINKPVEEPDFSDLFPYEGELWDSARVALITMRSEYPDFARSSVVNAISDEIEVDRMRAAMVDTDKIYQCSELDDRPQITGGMEQFFLQSGFQEVIDEYQISGTVNLRVLIDKDGVPVEVHSEEEGGGDEGMEILDRLLEKVEQAMRFDPPEYTGVKVQAECNYTIEFDFEN